MCRANLSASGPTQQRGDSDELETAALQISDDGRQRFRRAWDADVHQNDGAIELLRAPCGDAINQESRALRRIDRIETVERPIN
jgi:hypothetical protein